MYKEFLKRFKNPDGSFVSSVAKYSVENLGHNKRYFILLCYEDIQKRAIITLWDVDNQFINYEAEIPK